MTTVVSDTSPINYLCVIGVVDVLPRLFTEVLIPPMVLAELRHPRAPRQVAAWLDQMPDWVIVRPALHIRSDLGLDPGETEAISLALELSIPAIVIDEKRGRLAAERCGIYAVGTLNILEAAHSRGFLNFEDAVARLRGTNFHMDDTLIDALIAKIRSREGA